jgi:thiol-disulfide isomerase/thioredoxin
VDVYLKRSIHLKEVPALIKKTTENNNKAWERMRTTMPPSFAKDLARSIEASKLDEQLGYAEAFTKLKDLPKARAAVAAGEAWLAATPLGKSTDKDDQDQLKSRRRDLDVRKAYLLAAEGRALDALAQARAVLAGMEDADEKADLVAAMHGWYAGLGGNKAGFALFTHEDDAKKSTEGEWRAPEKPLADFALPDLQGKLWRLKDLRGKVLVISLWATWCGPCKEELPHVLELAQKLKGRRDVLLLSFNVDANPGLIDPFLKDHPMPMPVILANEFVDTMLGGSLSIPRVWIVDRRGKLTKEQTGYDSSAPWLDDVLAAIKAAGATL